MSVEVLHTEPSESGPTRQSSAADASAPTDAASASHGAGEGMRIVRLGLNDTSRESMHGLRE